MTSPAARVVDDAFQTAFDAARLASQRRREHENLASEAGELSGRLTTFVASAWPVLEPATPYIPNWHLDAVCDHLEAVALGEIRKLLITMPPRRGKSRVVSCFWPAWLWTFKPWLRLLFASYAEDLATQHSLDTRHVIQSDWYQQRFGHVFQLAGDQNLKTRFSNDKRGYRMATSVGGSATGFGGDILVSDDLLDREKGDSLLIRERTIRWFDLVLSKCLNDPNTGAQVMIMQRIHKRDPAGHVLDQGDWQHLCLPEEYDPKHPFLWPGDPRTEPGELLCEQRFDREAVDKEKRDPRTFAGLYQQIPTPREGLLIKRHWWRYYDPATVHKLNVFSLIQSWDTALRQKTTSDWTVGQLWGCRGPKRWLLRSVRGRWDLVEAKMQVLTMCQWARDNVPGYTVIPHTVLVENNSLGSEIIAQLRHEIEGLIPINPQKWGDKTQRVFAVTAQLEAGNVLLPGFPVDPDAKGEDYRVDPSHPRTPASTVELVEECASFVGSPNDVDDQVDAMTMALIRARGQDVSAPELDRVLSPRDTGKLDPSLGYDSVF
jgi:hypothetical protein